MKQNKYDDESFFAAYEQMPRSVKGLEAAGEWHVLRAMLPELSGRSVLDLGCGFGWHCRYAIEQGAAEAIGADISENMLRKAREATEDPRISYVLAPIEDVAFPDGRFDVVLSSLALHYVEAFGDACRRIHRFLKPGGAFVFSVEHPIFTARSEQDWAYDEQGNRLYWPVDDYQAEGLRVTSFLTDNVAKYHRTVSTYMNALISAGFRIDEVREPEPSADMLDVPGMRDELRRPMFLLVSATKP